MNESILLDIVEHGILVPFDKDGHRIPMNKREQKPFLIKMPRYILIIMPWGASFNIDDYWHRNPTNDLYSLRKEFFTEWIPNVSDRLGILTRIRSIELFTDDLPIAKTTYDLIRLADSGRKLRDYCIFELASLNLDTHDWSAEPKFGHANLATTSQVVENIQDWFRDLLGMPSILVEKLKKEINSYFVLPTDPASLYPPANSATYNRLIAGLKELDGEKMNKVYDDKIIYNVYETNRKHPWMSEDFIKKAFPPVDKLRGHRLTDSESMDLIFDGDVPHGKYICAIDTAYCKADVLATMEAFKFYTAFKENNMLPGIKKVIFNKPCTIVLWEDGTKTIVRTQGKARFDKEKGLAMCIAKKALGNKGNYYDEFRKWVK